MAQHLPSPFRQPQRYATHPAVPKLISRRFIRAQALLLLSAAIASGASPIAHETSSDGLVLDLKLPPYEVETTLGANASFHEILPPAGFGRLADSGRPALPFVAAPIAVPEGASIDVEVLDSHVVELADVHLRALQAPDAGEGASRSRLLLRLLPRRSDSGRGDGYPQGSSSCLCAAVPFPLRCTRAATESVRMAANCRSVSRWVYSEGRRRPPRGKPRGSSLRVVFERFQRCRPRRAAADSGEQAARHQRGLV